MFVKFNAMNVFIFLKYIQHIIASEYVFAPLMHHLDKSILN